MKASYTVQLHDFLAQHFEMLQPNEHPFGAENMPPRRVTEPFSGSPSHNVQQPL